MLTQMTLGDLHLQACLLKRQWNFHATKLPAEAPSVHQYEANGRVSNQDLRYLEISIRQTHISWAREVVKI